ncbi:hypothetical protein EXN66_Car007897 [Channa argus]|uniref:Uncharacterized protein n=1 Tax=Channa argus TaxID=215402 RepID=A0A6G1PPE8_CHAAH|nr:hypothetical protein EXN66_Car007897 [Channa argus]
MSYSHIVYPENSEAATERRDNFSILLPLQKERETERERERQRERERERE